MKVSGSGSTTGPSGPTAKARSEGGFSVGKPGAAQEAPAMARASGVSSVASVDALLALQAAEDAPARRRRAIGRASRLLDLMDEVKLALVSGETGAASLERLGRAVREARADVDDQGLTDLLNQIETRAAVELAKREPPRA